MSIESKNESNDRILQILVELKTGQDQLQRQIAELLKVIAEPKTETRETEEERNDFIVNIATHYPISMHSGIFSRYNRDPKLARELYYK